MARVQLGCQQAYEHCLEHLQQACQVDLEQLAVQASQVEVEQLCLQACQVEVKQLAHEAWQVEVEQLPALALVGSRYLAVDHRSVLVACQW